MKVAIAVQGRFHLFYLAQQLLKRDALGQLITTYPRSSVVTHGIPGALASTFPVYEAVARAWRRSPAMIRGGWNLQYFGYSVFDRFSSRSLKPGADLYVATKGIKCLRKAKSLGMVTVVERGSSHIAEQSALLVEEYARAGMRFTATHPMVTQRLTEEYELADYIAVPSLFVKRSFLARGVPERKLIHVPYGTNISEFRPVEKEDRTFRIVYCGSLSLRKGTRYLLQAFHELRLPDAELWLVGTVTDEIRPFLDQYASPRVVVQGHKHQSQLHWYYSQCNVFCMPSIEEGMAMVQLQAMACGLPLLCTTNTGGDDLIQDGGEGFVLPIRDVEALKSKIQWCYDNQEQCKAMGQAARQRLERGFTWDDYGERIYAEYQKAIASRRQAAQA